MTQDYHAIEMKAFLPAKDFDLCKKFYAAIGLDLKWSFDQLARFDLQHCSFLLQNFYVKKYAENFMMHLLVDSADAFWFRIKKSDVEKSFGIPLGRPQDREWGLWDFTLTDPSASL